MIIFHATYKYQRRPKNFDFSFAFSRSKLEIIKFKNLILRLAQIKIIH